MLSYQDVKIDPPSGNRVIEARGTGESGRGKSHSSGNRGMEKCRGTRGIGDLGFPVEPLPAGHLVNLLQLESFNMIRWFLCVVLLVKDFLYRP